MNARGTKFAQLHAADKRLNVQVDVLAALLEGAALQTLSPAVLVPQVRRLA
jgi:hypothetical protein